MKPIDLTVVILTYNSYSSKCSSVEFVINAYLNQSVQPKEILVINNSSDADNTDKLKKFCTGKPLVKILNCDKTVGGARNFAAEHAQSKHILFTEDDTIPLSNDVLATLDTYFNDSSYGYGADRIWSYDLDWIKENRSILQEITSSDDLSLLKQYGIIPNPQIRNKNDKSLKILLKSFIGNFGLISKSDFIAVGGFPEYKGYACEDDAFAFLCYLKLGMPKIFDDIKLLHISHPIKESSEQEYENNKKHLQDLIKSHGYSGFHISRILFKSENNEILDK